MCFGNWNADNQRGTALRGGFDLEVAADLEVPMLAVERRRTAAMKKLNVRSRAELARVAALHRW